MSCIATVREHIRLRGLIAPGSKVLAAVSGGPDSMALLAILSELAREMDFELAVAHFDHGIRPEAARERRLVERRAAALGRALFAGSGDVPAEARRMRTGIEETARLLRYRFLEETARAWGATAVATGHTRDDQVETILLHLIRGAGWRGLLGILPKRGIFIRPLLPCARAELAAYLGSRRIRYAVDRSNRKPAYLRNRVRNSLLPALRKSYNPSISEALLRLSANLAEGWETLERPLRRLLPRGGPDREIRIPLGRLRGLGDFQLYLLIDLALRERLGVFQDVERPHYDAAKRLIRAGRSGRRVRLPHGIDARIEHATFVLAKASDSSSAAGEAVIGGEGDWALPWWDLTLRIERVKTRGLDPRARENEGCFAGLSFPIRVRGRRPGDRMAPFGMRGTKKLSDLLIDRKVPLSRRGRIPVFEDDRGVFWLPGIAADERTRIGPRTRSALRVKLFPRGRGI
jgi:tRNA(Ile)-lysidine synthase